MGILNVCERFRHAPKVTWGECDMEQLLRWQVGDVRITRVQEIEAPGMRFIIPNTTIDNLIRIPWLTPFLAPNGDAVGRVHALTLEVQLGHNGSRYGRWLNVRMSFS